MISLILLSKHVLLADILVQGKYTFSHASASKITQHPPLLKNVCVFHKHAPQLSHQYLLIAGSKQQTLRRYCDLASWKNTKSRGTRVRKLHNSCFVLCRTSIASHPRLLAERTLIIDHDFMWLYRKFTKVMWRSVYAQRMNHRF